MLYLKITDAREVKKSRLELSVLRAKLKSHRAVEKMCEVAEVAVQLYIQNNGGNLKRHNQAKIIKKIGNFILAS